MSRQRAYQHRHAALGLCVFCPRLAVAYSLCAGHILKERARQRRSSRCRPWRPGGRGRPPRFTDAELAVRVARSAKNRC